MEIPGSTIKREVRIAAGCFIAAFLVNVIAIICYKGNWTEAFTQIGYVIVLSIIIYVLVNIIRLLVWLILSTVRRIRKPR